MKDCILLSGIFPSFCNTFLIASGFFFAIDCILLITSSFAYCIFASISASISSDLLTKVSDFTVFFGASMFTLGLLTFQLVLLTILSVVFALFVSNDKGLFVCTVAHCHSVLVFGVVVSLKGLLSSGHSFSNLIALVTLATSSIVSLDSFSAHFVAINLDNSFFCIQDNHLNAFAIYVFDVVLNTAQANNHHTRKLPIFHSTVLPLNGHWFIDNAHHIAGFENTDNISLAISALSFLDTASASVLDTDVSLFNIFTFHNHSTSATSSIYFLISFLMFLNHSAFNQAVSPQDDLNRL